MTGVAEDPYADVPEHAREWFRYEATLSGLIDKRTKGLPTSDDEIILAAGYADPDAFWERMLLGPTDVPSFARLLRSLHSAAVQQDRIWPIELGVRDAFRRALQSGESWVIRNPLAPQKPPNPIDAYAVLEPRQAIEWLLSQANERKLVPEALQAWLERPTDANMPARKGRHSGWPLVEQMFWKRAETGVIESTRVAEAKALAKLYAKAYPRGPSCTDRTIRNRLQRLGVGWEQAQERARNARIKM
jgi:hypothetical protein